MARLVGDHLPRGAFQPFGMAEAVAAHHWTGALPAEARVLYVAEARAFYAQRPVSYTVVFSPNALAEHVRAGATAAAILADWRARGVTHVYVNWLEMDRLGGTYGFWDEIDRALFARLERAGLMRDTEHDALIDRRYATLYKVPTG